MIKSPCLKICTMSPHNKTICSGCLRTLDEISSWRSLDDQGKLQVLAQVKIRRAKLKTP